MRLGPIFALVVLFILQVGDAYAQTYQQAVAAYEAGNYKAARKIALALAEHGDPRAQDLLSTIYLLGRGLQRDVGEATM